ncbi:hypothetical protein Scep_007435 [Stephania cephalantha]|uniref:UVR domain-containing protein n=1 Tax=Stephania cephalantha TaxID=152367 RepID=A0AAP0K9T0_9MAGN
MGCVENDERRDGLVAESVSSEEKLEGIRGGVMGKIGRIRGAVSEYMELKEELEEACEAEDFERADRVSERLSEVEKERCNL